MPKKRRSGGRPEMLSRNIAISSFRTTVRADQHVSERAGSGRNVATSIGRAIVQVKPELSVVLTWSHVEFDRVWALALAGQLKFAHLYFTKPHYNTRLVVSASFSNELEE